MKESIVFWTCRGCGAACTCRLRIGYIPTRCSVFSANKADWVRSDAQSFDAAASDMSWLTEDSWVYDKAEQAYAVVLAVAENPKAVELQYVHPHRLHRDYSLFRTPQLRSDKYASEMLCKARATPLVWSQVERLVGSVATTYCDDTNATSSLIIGACVPDLGIMVTVGQQTMTIDHFARWSVGGKPCCRLSYWDGDHWEITHE